MDALAFQDCYEEGTAHCFGCGRANPHGHHLRSFWDGEESVARFTPQPFHSALPGFVNGGILASIVDCHATGTAAAAAHRADGRLLGDGPLRRFVTRSLHVEFRRPTPLGPELSLRGRVTELTGRRIRVAVTVSAGERPTVEAEVVCVELPESMRPTGPPGTAAGGPPL